MVNNSEIGTNNLPIEPPVNQEHLILIDLLDQSRNSFYKQIKTYQKDLTEESVHDARVATRRLIALLDLLLPATVSNPDQDPMQELNKIIKLSGDLRDWDVQINNTFTLLLSNPGLKDFYSYLVVRRYQTAQRLKHRLKATDTDDLKKTFRLVNKQLDVLGNDPAGFDNIKVKILQTIDQNLLGVIEAGDAIDPDKPNTIHRLRLALKNYRYSVEVMKPFLTITETEYEDLQAYQTLLGDIQDLEVLGNSLDRYISNNDRADRDPLITVLLLLEGRKKILVDKLLQDKLGKHLTR